MNTTTPVLSESAQIIVDNTKEFLKDYEVFGNLLLIGIHKPPEKTKSGIILSNQTLDEAKWQSTVGLVLKVGPGAFEDRPDWKFYRQSVSVGKWVHFKTSSGFLMMLGKQECRLLRDSYVLGTVTDPEILTKHDYV